MKTIELLINKEKKEHAADGRINVPHCKSKRGRELFDKASAGFPMAQRHELNQDNILNYIRRIRRTANTYHWGSALNKIPTKDGPQSILFNNRSIAREEVMDDAKRC